MNDTSCSHTPQTPSEMVENICGLIKQFAAEFDEKPRPAVFTPPQRPQETVSRRSGSPIHPMVAELVDLIKDRHPVSTGGVSVGRAPTVVIGGTASDLSSWADQLHRRGIRASLGRSVEQAPVRLFATNEETHMLAFLASLAEQKIMARVIRWNL